VGNKTGEHAVFSSVIAAQRPPPTGGGVPCGGATGRKDRPDGETKICGGSSKNCYVSPSPDSPAPAAMAGIPSIRRSPVNCHETQELLHAYLDGELDIARDVAMAQHLDQCPECAQVYRRQQALRTTLRTSALAFPPP